MSVYYQLYKAECVQRTLVAALCLWGISSVLMLSTVGRILNIAFMLCCIGLWIAYMFMPVRRDANACREVRRIDICRLRRIYKYLLIAACGLFIMATVFNIAVYAGHTLSSLYDIAAAVSDFCVPLTVFALPLCVRQYSAAVQANSADSRRGRRRIRQLSGINVILLAVSVLISYFMMFYVSPAIAKTSSAYRQGVTDIKTHVLDYVTPLKNTIEDAASANILLDSLPLCDAKTETRYSDQTLYAKYSDVAQEDIKPLVVYNSTMLFALQDDLLCIQWDINGITYTVRRYRVTTAYENFTQILTGGVWMAELKKPITDSSFVEEKFEKFVGPC